MRNPWYQVLLGAACLISWFLWGLVLVFVSPEDLKGLSVGLFLLTAGFALFTSFLVLFYYLRIIFLKLGPPYRQFHIIFREASLLSSLLILVMILLKVGLASLLNFILLIILFFLIDLFFIINYDQRRSQKVK